MKDNEELKALNKKIMMINIISAPGFILLGFGLQAIFGTDDNALIPLLNNDNYAYAAIALGAVIAIWEVVVSFPLYKQKGILLSESDT